MQDEMTPISMDGTDVPVGRMYLSGERKFTYKISQKQGLLGTF